MLNLSAKNQASAYIKTPSSCPEYSAPLELRDGAVAASDPRERSAEAAQVTTCFAAGFPRERYSASPRFFSPMKVQWWGQAALASAFGVPSEAPRLSWQEEELPEQLENPLSRAFPN